MSLDDLEEMADIILTEDRREYPWPNHKADILLPDQWALRHKRERLTPTGHFDIGCKRGIYGRVWAEYPYRPRNRSRYSHHQDPWQQEVYESFWGT